MSDVEERDVRPLDINRLLETLARHEVDYVVIGGVATQVHGHRRTTMDLDLTPSPESENMNRLAAALAELEARPLDAVLSKGETEILVTDPDRLSVAAIVPPLLTRHGQVHILKEPKGARSFEQLRESALVIELDGIEVPVVSLDDLIRMKRAAGRPSDLDDLAMLTRVDALRRQAR